MGAAEPTPTASILGRKHLHRGAQNTPECVSVALDSLPYWHKAGRKAVISPWRFIELFHQWQR